jgi:hypothetical protein
MVRVKSICRSCATLVPALLVGTSMANAKVKANPQSSPSIVAQMDAASKQLHNVQANVQFDTFTKLVNDHDISSGTMFVERQGSSENMSASYTDAASPSAAKVLVYSGGVLQMYSPGTKQVDIFKAGANQARYESFLTLGFGGSGTDLQAAWTITDKGLEVIDGIRTEKLELVSKDPNVKKMFSLVTIWVDPARDVSLKQIFLQPSGDFRTAVYSNIRLNGKIDKKPYVIDPKANKVQH